eukprot:CAMPEP_0117426182 /NCGR_PEP_ID=MMETSP0758-20121206/6338_1 /TAXON_ID=63605 /ORGANISM="Percolomonas cosmopolitus, Strain AE-1 (ATCC 50343)" /LENGTH=385 /DNA_ID=CAMNT_0005211179 /DNA_START=160 /DNA_END=1314 /DNA_ORIENTATION=+
MLKRQFEHVLKPKRQVTSNETYQKIIYNRLIQARDSRKPKVIVRKMFELEDESKDREFDLTTPDHYECAIEGLLLSGRHKQAYVFADEMLVKQIEPSMYLLGLLVISTLSTGDKKRAGFYWNVCQLSNTLVPIDTYNQFLHVFSNTNETLYNEVFEHLEAYENEMVIAKDALTYEIMMQRAQDAEAVQDLIVSVLHDPNNIVVSENMLNILLEKTSYEQMQDIHDVINHRYESYDLKPSAASYEIYLRKIAQTGDYDAFWNVFQRFPILPFNATDGTILLALRVLHVQGATKGRLEYIMERFYEADSRRRIPLRRLIKPKVTWTAARVRSYRRRHDLDKEIWNTVKLIKEELRIKKLLNRYQRTLNRPKTPALDNLFLLRSKKKF